MKGLREINRADGPHVDDVDVHRRQANAWLDRAREKLKTGDYEGAMGALHGAKGEVNALLPVHARAA